MSFISHYRVAPRPDAPAWTLRNGLGSITRAGVVLTIVAAPLAALVATLLVNAPVSTLLTRAWRDGLETTLGAPVARCVVARMNQRVSMRELEATLKLTNGDLSADPRFSALLASSIERCRVQPLLLVQ